MARTGIRVGTAIAVLVLLIAPAAVSAPPTGAVALTDPAGIGFRGDALVAAESGAGRVVAIDDSAAQTALLERLIPGVFSRGPTGIAVDGAGNVYAAVADDGVVLFATPDGSTGVYARGLGVPTDIAFDPAGNLYVADEAGSRILRVSPKREIAVAADGLDAAPFALALSPAGEIFVSTPEDGRVLVVGASGATPFVTIDGRPEGMAFGDDGTLYVVDGRAGTLQAVAPPQEGLPALATPVLAERVSGPARLAVSPGGELWVSAQGEAAGGGLSDVVAPLSMPASFVGHPPATPMLTPTPLPDLPDHTVVHKGGGLAVDPAPYADILPVGTETDVGLGAFEPTVGVSDTGAVFYNPKPTAGINTQHIMRSTDEGKTWEDVSPRVPPGQIVPPTDLDPYVYVDRDTGRVFTVQLYVGCSYLSFSDDDGETWIQNPLACGIPGNDHQSFYAGPTTTLPTTPAYPNALYYCYNGIVYSGCGRSLDGGLTFEPAGIPYPPGGCAGLTGHVAVGGDGTVYLPKSDCNSGPMVAVSRDDGTTWSRVQVAGPSYASGEHESHVAVDGAGNAYYVWLGPDRRPFLSVSTDTGRTWSEPIMVGAPGVTQAWGPSIAAGDDGKIAVYYTGNTSTCCYTSRSGGERMWHAYVTLSVDASSEDPTFLSTTFNDPTDPVRRGTCGPGRCGARPTSLGDFLEVFVDHNGKTWAAMVDSCVAACAQIGLSGGPNAERGQVGQLVRGPKLVGDGVLQPPPWYEG